MSAPPVRSSQSPPPSRSVAHRQLVLGAVLATAGVGAITLGAWTAGAALVVVSAPFFLGGALLRLSGDAVPIVNTAFNAATEGRVADAERLLDQVEGRYQIRYIRRVIDLQRANIALRRGDLDAAAARLDAALARPPGLLTGREERGHVLGAHAMRALVRASKGEPERARVDVAVVRANPLATAEVLARAAVAEAILLDRAGDRDALGAHLAAERRLLLDHTAPRERAVVRAYRRMLAAPRTSVYRQAATREPEREAGDEPPIADWIARIAPAAAPFVRGARPAAGGAPAARPADEKRVEPGLVRLAEERLQGKGAKKASPRPAKVLALWVLLIVMFAAIWQLLTPEGAHPVRAAAAAPSIELGATALVSMFAVLFIGIFAVMLRRNLRFDRRLAGALGALARGDEDAAVAELEALARGQLPLVAAQAHRELARIAERRADFAAALAHCDEGIGEIGARPETRAIASPMLLPDLVAERAFVLAATDRHDKARAEMEVLATQFPAYPFRAPAELRVALVERVRRGDLEGAARIAEARSEDVPLPLRDETLADLVRAAVRPEAGGAYEIERLKDELRLDAGMRGWLEAVAPALLASFTRGDEEPADDARDAEAEAEAEALAEAEAEAARARAG